MIVKLPEVRHDLHGFQALVHLVEQTQECYFDDIVIDMHQTMWFDADMCSAFGAILYRMGEELNGITLTNITPDVQRILSKNGFLSVYGREQIPDTWRTTIAYKRFDIQDDRYFTSYIENEFLSRPELPAMSEPLLKRIRESVFEIFSNSVLHSETKQGIYSCGQYFPARNRINFCITDLGIGIMQNLKLSRNISLSPEDAIKWATEDSNTTKQGPIPGGLGLKLLREFIDVNGGAIQIVSDAGYWKHNRNSTTTDKLNHPFPGTVVNVEINTADTQSYALLSEVAEDDIF